MINKLEILSPNATYHIYNRANGSEKIFLSNENYRFFLQKYSLYISAVADTFCYCLMPNHFHFLIRIKSEKEIIEVLKTFPKFITLEKLNNQTIEKFISKQFSNLFSSYTQAFNKQQNRQGSLFIKNFKRKKISDKKYLNNLIHYIHFNLVEAKLSKNSSSWKYSSYIALISNLKTELKRSDVIQWFENIENFKYVHTTSPKEIKIEM